MLALTIIGLTILGHVVLIYVLLRHNSSSITNRLIAYISLISILWTIFNYLPYTTTDEYTRLLYVRAVMFSTASFGYIVYLLARAYPNKTLPTKSLIDKIYLFGGAVATVIITILSLTPLVFSRVVSQENNSFSLESSYGLVIYAIVGLFLMLSGFVVLTKKYVGAVGYEKKQLQFFMLGLMSSFTLMASTNLLAIVLFDNTALTVLGPTFTLIFISAMTYAIVKHGFLEISTLIVRSLFYILVVVVIGASYSALIVFLSVTILQEEVTVTTLVAGMIAAVVAAFSFPFVQAKINKFTEKIFYKDWYDSNALLYKAAIILSSTLETKKLVDALVYHLDDAIHFTSAAVVLKGERGLTYYSYGSDWDDEKNEKEQMYAESLGSMTSKQMIASEFKHGTWLSQHHARMVIKLEHDSEVLGVFILGERKSGDIYVEKDKNALAIIAPQFALALRNVQSYQEIEQFNVTLRDEVEHATKKLRSANHRLLELDKLKDEFVSLASHELRTPMVSIRNYIWMVLNGKGGKVNPKQREFLRRAYDSTSRLSRLVNSMLNLSRIESGRVILSVQQADIRMVLKDVVTEIGARADQLGIKLVIRQKIESVKTGDAVQLPTVIIDIDKIKEVLVNLIGNSLKFTPVGGSITVALSVDPESVHISVTDTGVGLEKDQIPKLFQKFSMLRESYSANATTAQGTGLGLYICKSIIEMHGGKIWVESEGRGKGSSFIFTVPRFSEKQMHLMSKNTHAAKDAGIIHTAVGDY